MNDLLGARNLLGFLICLATWLPETVAAQNQSPEEPREEQRNDRPKDAKTGWEDFHRQKKDFNRLKKDFIIKNSGMTTEETARFFEYYDVQMKRLHEINAKIRKACRRIKKETLSERDCERIVAEVEKLQAQAAALETEKLKQWRECVPASKVLKIINAECELG